MSGCHKSEDQARCVACQEVLKNCKCIWRPIRELQHKINKLEQLVEGQIENDHKTLAHHVDNLRYACARIEKLESSMQALTEMYKQVSLKHAKLIDMEMNQRKPYKCPVCDGCGAWIGDCLDDGTYERKKFNCYPCQGKGIVWG